MSTIVIEYSALQAVVQRTNDVSRQVQDYADALSRRVSQRFGEVQGGASGNLNSASYLVNKKISDLRKKASTFSAFSRSVSRFAETARRVDDEVKRAILDNQNRFVNAKGIAQPGWKEAIINWLVDLKNSNVIFRMIGDVITGIQDAMGNMLDEIRYWYKCEGGKEIVDIALAFGGAIVAVLLCVASFGTLFAAAGVFSVIAATAGVIGSLIAVVDSAVNLGTSLVAYESFQRGDRAWAKIYGEQDKLTDVLRAHNFGSAELNNFWNTFANSIEIVDTVCAVIGLIEGIAKIATKISCIKNYFSKNGGLLNYMKEAEWGEFKYRDEISGEWSTRRMMVVNDAGEVQMKYTPRSIFNGLKAYVTNAPIDREGMGLRTMLNKNFMQDMRDIKNSFTKDGIKDTLRYRKENNRWLTLAHGADPSDMNAMAKLESARRSIGKDFKITTLKELKNLKNYAKPLQNVMKVTEKVGGYLNGDSMSFDFEGWVKKNTWGGQYYSTGEKFVANVDTLITDVNGSMSGVQIGFDKNTLNTISSLSRIDLSGLSMPKLPPIPKINIPVIAIPQINVPKIPQPPIIGQVTIVKPPVWYTSCSVSAIA